jgi:hypothetical protein
MVSWMIKFSIVVDKNLNISRCNLWLLGYSRNLLLLLLIIVTEYSRRYLLSDNVLNNFRVNLTS